MEALKEFVLGHRGIFASLPVTDTYSSLLDDMVENDDKMRKMLAASPELLAQYQATLDSIEESHCELELDQYTEGLRFGILLGMDVCKAPKERK